MAEHKFLKLTIARVDGPIFADDVISVSVPGVLGDMQILAHHEALISPLKAGTIAIEKQDGTVERIAIGFGTLEISNNHATILV